ncbi:MAG: hypothetical protein SV201_14100 [Pseudomonadota bacterium]|nr:hypothetical protein [Pseudomonadota bacterium]
MSDLQQDWSVAPFQDFYEKLKGHNNINTAFKPGKEASLFLTSLLNRASLLDRVTVSAPGHVQTFVKAQHDGKIYIEQLVGTVTWNKKGNKEIGTGTYETFTIDSDFSVSEGTAPYKSIIHPFDR